MNRARQQANLTKCLAQMRSLMQGLTFYTNENRGSLPFTNWGGGTNAGWLYDPTIVTMGNYKDTDMETGTMWPYLKDHRLYRCPGDTSQNWPATTVQMMTSYTMNGAICDFGHNPPSGSVTNYPEKMSSFPSNSIMMWEIPASMSTGGNVNDGSNYPDEGMSTRHNHGCSVGCADGHAEPMTWTDFTNEWYYHQPGRLYCAPHYAQGGLEVRALPSSPPPEPVNSY